MDTLFQNNEEEQPFTVSELNNFIKNTLESTLRDIFIIGEISGFKKAFPSGHSYFTLKDDKSQISCNLWKFRNIPFAKDLKDGQKVLIRGKITVYLVRGTYAIDVVSIKDVGQGDIQIAFEKLKEKLLEEGLFDEKYKKLLPEFPEKIAIITSETGAVIQDFIKISKKRYPLFTLYLYPVLVQGTGSRESICKAIQNANESENNYDVIVIARGGGSAEDLMSFNEESVVRTVFASKIPVVSAVGHQVDYTLCDLVADKRAATPSEAAEIILPDKSELLENLKDDEQILHSQIKNKIDLLKEKLIQIQNNYAFKKPKDILNDFKIKIDEKSDELISVINERLDNFNNDLNYKERILRSVSPDKTLKRGYTYIKKNNNIISKSSLLKKNDEIQIVFADGEKDAKVE